MFNTTLLPLSTASCYASSSSSEDSVKNAFKRPLLDQADHNSCEKAPHNPIVAVIRSPSFAASTQIGFFLQVITLCASVMQEMKWGSHTNNNGILLFWCIRLLSQIDICIYAIIWVTFTLAMTECGFQFLRRRLASPTATRKSIFHSGITVLVGVVVGSFGASMVVDALLGSPNALSSMLVTLIVDLLLCYGMVLCYDWGEDETIGDAMALNNIMML
jgi:hypothetical protein